MCHQTLAKVSRGFAKVFFVCAGKCRIVLKTAGIADLGDRRAGGDHFFGEEQPFGVQIIPDRIASLFLKAVHQIGTAQEKVAADIINGNIISQMVI